VIPDIEYIDTPEKLDKLCLKMRIEPWLAIDTEFLREKTYYPKFCLLQIASTEWVACVDPLLLPDLDKLFEVLCQPTITKVLHACRQDIEIFYQLTRKIPGPIFDTQLAAPLLGFQENPGYAMLISSLLKINLGKAHTRTDWSIRPLRPEQVEYAAEDVIYLGQIYQKITRQLAALGRTDWLQEDFAALLNTELYQMPAAKAWLKIKGKNKLTGKQLAVLQALAEWRELTAQNADKPRNWLLRDDALLDLARLQPITVQDFSKLRSINERTANRYGKQVCALVLKAQQQAPIKLDNPGRSQKINSQQEAVLDVLTAIIRIRAEENSINPVILASRKDLEKLLFADPACVLLHGWRYTMAGRELQAILQGKHNISIQSGRFEIIPDKES